MTNTALLNKSRALKYMEACGLDALIVASSVNVGYVAGYFCWLNSLLREYMLRPGASSGLPETYAILTRDGGRALVVNSIFAADSVDLSGIDVHVFGSAGLDQTESTNSYAQNQALWDLLSHASEPASPLQALLRTIRSQGLAGGRIGIELDGMPSERTRGIAEALPAASLRDCSNLLRLIRAVKSPEEIQRLTRAAEISESAGMAALGMARAGFTLHEMAQCFHGRAATMGAVFDHFAYSPKGLGIAMEADYRLKDDDVLYVDFGCKFSQYFADTGLTLAMNDLPSTLERRYAALHACIAAGAREMKPGRKASQVQKAMADEFSSHGFNACFPHGHGLGLEVRDYPIFVPDSGLTISDDCVTVSADLPVEEGMVNNLEACAFLPGLGSVHLEKSFLVTAEGNRELTEQNRDQPFRGRCIAS
jgi:Xaa-Pro dipeptidase